MPGTPRPTRLAFAILALSASTTLTSCTSNNAPTAGEAGQTLKAHILQLLKERNAQNVTITDPGGRNIPCGNGKVKQTFAATGGDLHSETKPDALNEMLLGALPRVANYAIVQVGGAGAPTRVSDKAAGTVLLLDSQRNGQYEIRGETTCLSES